MIGVISEDENHNKIFKPMAGATLGQGVPLGAWCSFEKDVAPSNNWLMACTTFDATKYPALNLYLGTNKVPSRYDHNRPSEIQTLITRGTTVRPFTAEYDADITIELDSGESRYITVNGDNYELTSARATNSITLSVKKGDIVSCTGSSSITAWAIYGVYYSHPLFIKATSIASDSDKDSILAQIQEYNTYSTEETLTGKTWIDGKPIYRKVVIFDNATSWNRDSWGLIPNSANDVPNAEQIVSFFAFALPYGKLAIATHGEAYAESDGIHYYSTVSISLKSYTVEYTKTTD